MNSTTEIIILGSAVAVPALVWVLIARALKKQEAQRKEREKKIKEQAAFYLSGRYERPKDGSTGEFWLNGRQPSSGSRSGSGSTSYSSPSSSNNDYKSPSNNDDHGSSSWPSSFGSSDDSSSSGSSSSSDNSSSDFGGGDFGGGGGGGDY